MRRAALLGVGYPLPRPPPSWRYLCCSGGGAVVRAMSGWWRSVDDRGSWHVSCFDSMPRVVLLNALLLLLRVVFPLCPCMHKRFVSIDTPHVSRRAGDAVACPFHRPETPRPLACGGSCNASSTLKHTRSPLGGEHGPLSTLVLTRGTGGGVGGGSAARQRCPSQPLPRHPFRP